MRARLQTTRRRWLPTLALALALGIVAAGCGSEPEDGEITADDPDLPEPTDEGADDEAEEAADEPTEEEAEPWPTDPVTFVVPAGPGSTIDRLIRGAEPYLSESLGVPVSIENQEGGAFTVGMQHVLSQPADGSTVFVFVDPFFTGARLQMDVPADAFEYLGGVAFDTPAIIGGPDRFEDLNDVLAALEAGERVLFGVLPGDPAWAGFREVLSAVGLDAEPEYVAYSEGGELRTDLLGGHVDMIIGNHGGFLPIHEAGDGRFLVFFSEERYDDPADVPTAAEVVETQGGDGASAPVLAITRMFSVRSEVADDHPERAQTLSDAVMALTEHPEFLAWAEGEGLPIEWVPPDVVARGTVEFEALYERYPEVLGN